MRNPALTWSADDLRDYDGVHHKLPVLEESVTQLEDGPFSAGVSIVSAGGVTLYRARIGVRSVGVTVLDPAYVGFAVPLWSRDGCTLNGHTAQTSAIYLPTADGVVYVRGGRRDTLGVLVKRSALIETVAALRGVSPDEVILDDRPHVLYPAGAGSLHRRLLATLDAKCGDGLPGAPRDTCEGFAEEVLGLITDAYLYARPEETPRDARTMHPASIVRRAEERFNCATSERTSLADLCVAAGVAKSTLYRAFAQVCDAPPLEYFRRRRMTRARSILMAAVAPNRGGVKRAALGVGMTELGRFSVEYRRMFGESPSTTLNRRWS